MLSLLGFKSNSLHEPYDFHLVGCASSLPVGAQWTVGIKQNVSLPRPPSLMYHDCKNMGNGADPVHLT